MSKVIVVGGGPSGMMAALTASKNGHQVTLIERNDELGKKLKLTGGGRCNITNKRYIEEFFDKVVTNEKFLYSAFYSFTNEDLLDFLSESNFEYKVEEHNDYKVYTNSDKATELINLFKNLLLDNKINILYNSKVVDLIVSDNKIEGVILEDNTKIYGDKVIISTGGKSHSKTGSDGTMHKILAKYGHNVTTTYPALSPLKIKEDFTRRLQGISLKGVEISCKLNKRKKISKRGDMLFAHFGITGPVVLIISSYINKLLEKEPVELTIDCVPDISEEEIRKAIRENPNKNIAINLKDMLQIANNQNGGGHSPHIWLDFKNLTKENEK